MATMLRRQIVLYVARSAVFVPAPFMLYGVFEGDLLIIDRKCDVFFLQYVYVELSVHMYICGRQVLRCRFGAGLLLQCMKGELWK